MVLLIAFLLLYHTCASTAQHESMQQLDAESLSQESFLHNMMANTSAEDPELDNYLWKGIKNDDMPATKTGGRVITYDLQSKLTKRVWSSKEPLIKVPCLFCGKKARDHGGPSLNTFTVDAMISRMKFGATYGDCLFYGQRPSTYKDTEYGSLSRIATDWACAQSIIDLKLYRTIWQLWPYETNGDGVTSCETGQNYYCLNYAKPKCCWLNSILGDDQSKWKDNGMAYFRAMSRAMARTCSGHVWVLMDNKKMLLKQYSWAKDTPSIWLQDELPELKQRYNSGQVTGISVIRYGDFRRFDRTGYVFKGEPEPSDAQDNDPNAPPADGSSRRVRSEPVKDDDEELIEAMAVKIAKALKEKQAEVRALGEEKLKTELLHLRKRGICPSGADQESPGMDYFG